MAENADGEAPYETLVEHSGDMLFMLDEEGRYTYVNSRFCEVSGYERAELEGETPETVLGAEAVEEGNRRIRALLRMDAEEGESWRATLHCRDGTTVPIDIRFRLRRGDDGEYRGVVGAARDVREQQYREQQLDVLTRVLRHNFRNQLNVILGKAHLIATGADADADRHASKIAEVAGRLARTSEKARAVQRNVLAGDPGGRVTELVGATEAVLDDYRDAYPDTEFRTDTPSEAYVRVSDAYRTALSELVENAVEHCPPERTPLVAVELRRHPDEGSLTVAVEDRCEPIPDDEVAAIRRGAEQALSHGSGLGLWLVNWVVGAAGGRLVFTTCETGNRVEMHLPVAASEYSPDPPEAAED